MSINKNFATLLSLVTSKAAIASFKYIDIFEIGIDTIYLDIQW